MSIGNPQNAAQEKTPLKPSPCHLRCNRYSLTRTAHCPPPKKSVACTVASHLEVSDPAKLHRRTHHVRGEGSLPLGRSLPRMTLVAPVAPQPMHPLGYLLSILLAVRICRDLHLFRERHPLLKKRVVVPPPLIHRHLWVPTAHRDHWAPHQCCGYGGALCCRGGGAAAARAVGGRHVSGGGGGGGGGGGVVLDEETGDQCTGAADRPAGW